MSSLNLVSLDPLRNPVTPNRINSPAAITAAIAVTVFLSAEIYSAATAAVWAATGLLHLGSTFTVTLYVLAVTVASLAIVKIAKLAWASETDPENNL